MTLMMMMMMLLLLAAAAVEVEMVTTMIITILVLMAMVTVMVVTVMVTVMALTRGLCGLATVFMKAMQGPRPALAKARCAVTARLQAKWLYLSPTPDTTAK